MKRNHILFGFIWVGLTVVIVIALNKLKLRELDWILALLGLTLFLIILFYLFKSKKPLMFIILGLMFFLVRYLIASLLSSRYSDLPEVYTFLAAIILPILALFSFISTLLAAIYIFKEIFRKGR